MIPKYRFYLEPKNTRIRYEAHPVYGADLSVVYGKESGEQFFRKSLSQGVTFVRDDFDFIMQEAIETEFAFICDFSADFGRTFTEYFRASFTRLDGEIDYDSNTFKVTPNIDDEYTQLLDNIENEHNIMKYSLETMRVDYYKRGMLQIYVPNDSIVSCFVAGMTFEQDANPTESVDELTSKYHFTQDAAFREIQVTMNGTPDVGGTYYGQVIYEGLDERCLLKRTDGKYELAISVERSSTFHSISISIRSTDPVEVLFAEFWESTEWWGDTAEFTLYALSQQATGTAHCKMTSQRFFGRYITNVEEYQTEETYPIPSDDVVQNNRNYKRIAKYRYNRIRQSIRLSETPTEYGITEDGRYYLPPEDEYGVRYFPVARSTWRNTSFWYAYGSTYYYQEYELDTPIQLRDAYSVGSIIKLLLSFAAPDIKHEETPEYSEFLYSNRNPITGDSYRLLCTPKSNIIVGEYQTPAQKAFTTLRQFLAMLANVYRCYWHIEDGKLRIEHISWYKNGGSYDGQSQEIGYDLTTLLNVRNGKPLAYGTSKVTFDKQSMPSRYEFNWMDESTELFKGFPIIVNSSLCQKDKKETIDIGNFTSDIDYITLNAQSVSQDGFALMAAKPIELLKNPFQPTQAFGTMVLSSPAVELTQKGGKVSFEVSADAEGDGYAFVCLLKGSERIVTYPDARIEAGETKTLEFEVPEEITELRFIVNGRMILRPLSMKSKSAAQLTIDTIQIDNINYYLQNANLAMVKLQPDYWSWDLPAYDVTINNLQLTANGIKRGKKQNIEFPVVNADADLSKLVKTYIGNGQIEQMNINLSSRMAQTILCYDTK